VRHRPSIARPSRAAALALVVVVALAACGGGSTPTGPAAVVQDALVKLADKDLEGLQTLACEGQQGQIEQLLNVPAGSATALLPGIDMQAVLDAVRVDVSKVVVGEAAIDGDVAQVPLSGEFKVTFDADALRPIVRQLLDQQGATMSDEQLNALLQSFQAYGQDVPLNQTVRLVQESGAWKICQDSVQVPGAS
jgi:hypothetical protein